MSVSVNVIGLNDVLAQFNGLHNASAQAAVGNVVETYARKMANESAGLAPIKDGALKGSIASSPEEVDVMLWEYGSNLPYAQRQEYEHATAKGFIRKSVWNNRTDYRDAIKRQIIAGG